MRSMPLVVGAASMSDIIECPNCGASMNCGDPCPECDHDDGDCNCPCACCWENNEGNDGDVYLSGPQRD